MEKQYDFNSTLFSTPLEPSKSSHYPFMVEFTGTPEAGKTTCIKEVKRRLEETGIKVSYVRESAEIIDYKIYPKNSFESHLAMRLTTVMAIMETCAREQCDILLIDRGLLDGIFFTKKFIEDFPMWTTECNGLISMLDNLDFMFPSIAFIFSCSTEEAIRRRGGEGKLVTYKFVDHYNKLLETATFPSQTVCYKIDSTALTPDEVATKAMRIIKASYKKHQHI